MICHHWNRSILGEIPWAILKDSKEQAIKHLKNARRMRREYNDFHFVLRKQVNNLSGQMA
jgi:hypothetical protein